MNAPEIESPRVFQVAQGARLNQSSAFERRDEISDLDGDHHNQAQDVKARMNNERIDIDVTDQAANVYGIQQQQPLESQEE